MVEHEVRNFDATAVREVRIRFSKGGPMTYLSHLDFARNMMRAIVKSHLPVWYTKGFNPIPKLAFASPLSVGCRGEREIADIKVTTQITDEEISSILSEYLPDGIKVVEVYTAQTKFKLIKWALNEIQIHSYVGTCDVCEKIEELFKSPVIMMKRSKSGEKEVDITKYIKSLQAAESDGILTISAVTGADSEGYLNPEYIVSAVNNAFNLEGDNGWHITVRKKLLLEDGITEYR